MAASGNKVFDVLIVGGGLAGWRAAEAAVKAGASVALVYNGCGNSPQIHALNCPVLPEDSAERMFEDTMSAGHGTNDPALVRVLCEKAVALKEEFPFDRDAAGNYLTIRPLGSSVPRCVSIDHAIGAWALSDCRRSCANAATVFLDRVKELEPAAEGYEVRGEGGAVYHARAVVLASGGWCGVYDFSTNPPYLKGDGIKLAERLGAATRDMDAVQYEPTGRVEGPNRGVPVITTLLYKGARLRNVIGEEFLSDVHLNKDELSQAITREIKRTGAMGVWYDLDDVADEDLLACKMSLEERRILVAPAPHTSLGGVVIDASCHVLRPDGSAIPHLYAAGEVTGGLHGRNRLGGNAGTEVLVFGRIAGETAAKEVL